MQQQRHIIIIIIIRPHTPLSTRSGTVLVHSLQWRGEPAQSLTAARTPNSSGRSGESFFSINLNAGVQLCVFFSGYFLKAGRKTKPEAPPSCGTRPFMRSNLPARLPHHIRKSFLLPSSEKPRMPGHIREAYFYPMDERRSKICQHY